MKAIAAWAGVGLLLVFGAAIGQEMKCSQVFMNPSETRICASDILLKLDREMAQAYRRTEPHMRDINKTQKIFRKGLKSCKGDDACLIRSYQARNAELRAFINTLPMATEDEAQTLGAAADEATIERGDTPVVQELVAAAPVVPKPEPVVEEPIREVVEPVAAQDIPPSTPSDDSSYSWWAYLIGLFAVLALLAAAWDAFKDALLKRCPKCHKWNAGDEFDQETVAYRDFRTITREDKRRDKQGQLLDTTERREQVWVRVEDTTHHLRCKFCRKEWTYNTRRVSE